MTKWSELAREWLSSDGPAAIVCRQWLMPVEGRDAAIFPPTFAAAEGGGKSNYNIDAIEAAPGQQSLVAIVDTVGSQANRMEPLFKRSPGTPSVLAKLVPQIEIIAGERTVNLLDAGHRAGDAVVRYSELGSELNAAFVAYRDTGDGHPLAKLAPTSLVFGAWDSRDTKTKLPRLLASTIRAFDVATLTRSAQYNPPLDYADLGLIDEAADKQVLEAASQLGFRHAPSVGAPGGVLVRGEIRREAVLSLVGLRAVGPSGSDGESLRRYLLGLALIAMTHDRAHDLRQGCLLVADPDRRARWELVRNDGGRTEINPEASGAVAFATDAASAFGVGPDRRVRFDPKAANEAIKEKVGAKKAKSKKA